MASNICAGRSYMLISGILLLAAFVLFIFMLVLRDFFVLLPCLGE